MMGYYNDYTWYGMGIFGPILMILFWGAIIWFIVWLLNRNGNFNHNSYRSPADILKERYAKGEITKKTI